ncbi:ribonuclease J [Marinitenerispora sediminis]|uniref:Ribonuclease J n=1 Tax=Marinitenerispora sediminis TaxID=1931232 RepID=A0A368T2S6_9ACTN|nr:ribonuclease J [Marinitenerispora sediminis]RCV52177.1 RNase J family beta-CASP ribonuclease [Marinitenerispora sediminis]RCV53106.1 RNase J family beta-CASP ribonuclease [Marinitenerispora sediminis]RCV56219.1 RNase J family beta-CASP ribonuclease [Marinitenerispora sediminis]
MSHPHPELGPPPPLPAGALRIVPLGGLGEIGRNMTVFEYDGRLLIIDCGVLFPEEEQPGVDLILPDFDHIRDRLDDVEALVLTHGHEDHIGAVPFLLRERPDIPLVGSRLTLALVSAKLGEHRIKPELVQVAEGERHRFGVFDCEFFAVNHSIPDALAVGVRTPGGSLLHTGDFKMDQLPLDGRLTDLAGFARFGDEGVDLLLSDSTNAEVPGFVTHERDISGVIDKVFGQAGQRIIVACFASHIHRVQQVLDAAQEHGRKVAFVGRSMVRNMNIARDLGYLRVPGGLLVDVKELDAMAPNEAVLISTGSQGEPMSALTRMANRDHQIRIEPGDTVVLASSLIPGNENSVNRVINGLTRWGAKVVHKGNALVHVSGHAPAGELLYVLNMVRPRNFMPVHGEWRHLRAHAQLATLTGVPEKRVVIAEDGVVVDLVDGKASIVGAIPAGYVYVDGASVGDVTESALKDRRILGEEGFISVIVAVDSSSGKLVGEPQIHTRGSGIDVDAYDEVVPKIQDALERAAADGINDVAQLRQLVRRSMGRWVNETYRRRPMIVPVVLEV